jgi:uncharacterized coiled-coil protein SlyX
MSAHRSSRAPFAAACVLALAACGPDAETERRLAALDTISAEKDSLLVQVAENARLMSEIGAELARVYAPAATAGAAEAPLAITRENLLSDIRTLTTRLQESEARLVESEERIAGYSGERTAFERTIGELRASIANQKQTIVSLTEQVEALRDENTRLAEANVTLAESNVTLADENLALADTLSLIAERENTIYYAIGTKEDLLQRGVITEEGGSRVLFVFGKRGKTLVPARELDPAQFVMADRRTFSDVPLEADKEYTVVSRQDFAALEPPPDEEGRVHGFLRIADPDRFWAGGRYLIVVQR